VADEERVRRLVSQLPLLSSSQFSAIENIVAQLNRPFSFWRNPESDLISDCILREFGDALRIHHCFSAEPFTKDKFEYALEKTCNCCDLAAIRAPRGNPGHDLTIASVPFSLKTQADASIRSDYIHISKFMELGKGEWGDKVADLIGLRGRFFHHMRNYQRILTLRRLKEAGRHVYELVEIPKRLLLSSSGGEMAMRTDSKQFPKPGYCTVKDAAGRIMFQLYFDGGTERKLQIKRLDKLLCIVHATWKFEDGLVTPRMEEGIAIPYTSVP